MRIPAALGVVILAVACAPGQPGSARACTLMPQDSAFLAGGDVSFACDVDRQARLQGPSPRIDYRPPGVSATGARCESAVIRFVVGPDGTPEVETARVVRATTPAFGDAVLASLPRMRYTPALRDGQPVRQVVEEQRSIAIRVGGTGPTPRC